MNRLLVQKSLLEKAANEVLEPLYLSFQLPRMYYHTSKRIARIPGSTVQNVVSNKFGNIIEIARLRHSIVVSPIRHRLPDLRLCTAYRVEYPHVGGSGMIRVSRLRSKQPH